MLNHIRDWGANGPCLWFEDDDSSSSSDADRTGQNFSNDHIIMEPLKILAWNARGVASQEFRRTFKELMAKYNRMWCSSLKQEWVANVLRSS